MSDKTAAFVDTHGLGRLDERLALRGKLAVPGVGLLKAELCTTPRGVWVVAAESDARGDALNLLERPDFRYERGALGDKLRVADCIFGVSRTRSARARQLIGLSRLRQRFGEPISDRKLARTPFVEAISELERVWLSYTLSDDEILLAWIHGVSEAFVSSPIEVNAHSELRLLVTSRDTRLVAITELGDVRAETLDTASLRFDLKHGQATLRTPNWEFCAKRRNDELTREVLGALLEPTETQLLWFAQQCWLSRSEFAGGARTARRLAQLAEAAGSPLAAFARVVIQEPAAPELSAFNLEHALARLGDRNTPEDALARLAQSWQLSPQVADGLVSKLRAQGQSAEPWSLALHQYVHRVAQGDEREAHSEAAERDIRLSEHLLECGKTSEARRLLEERLRDLPSEDLDDLLPPEDADLTQGAGGKTLRIRIRELIAESRETTDLDTLAELAQLQPLMQARVTALADAAEGTLRLRAESVAALLKPAGLIGDSGARESVRRDVPLSEDELNHLLSHPLAREESPFTTKLQALLASVPTPDHGVLKDYCERLEATGNATAEGALEDASRVLGVPRVSAYVSRGNKSIGVRAYEDGSPFVLIGGQHLEEGPYRMTASELRFALGAELGHVRFGHTPVTSSEVWAGALNKTREGVDFAFTFLPLLKGYKLAGRMSQALSKVPAPAVRQLLSGVERLRARINKTKLPEDDPAEAALSRINEELITAHRVMQLTADRAGLLVSADLQASIRAMLLLRADHRVLLDRSLREGLISVLRERNQSGEMAHQALAVRIAALFSFYLSSEYARLAVKSSA